MALGKNLENILGDYFGEESVDLKSVSSTKTKLKNPNTSKEYQVIEVKINEIEDNPHQTRKFFDPDKIDSLAKNIDRNGLLNPITLLKEKGQYVLLAGDRRLRAYKVLGKEKIPAIIKSNSDLSSNDKFVISVSENLHRENLNPIELAKTFEILLEKQSITIEKLASSLGNTVQYIKHYLNLLSLNSKVIKFLEENKLTEGLARQLVPLTKDVQYKYAKIAVDQKLSVRKLIALLKKDLKKEKYGTSAEVIWRHNLPRHTIGQLQSFSEQFPDAKIKAKGDEKKGKIEIVWGE